MPLLDKFVANVLRNRCGCTFVIFALVCAAEFVWKRKKAAAVPVPDEAAFGSDEETTDGIAGESDEEVTDEVDNVSDEDTDDSDDFTEETNDVSAEEETEE